MVAKSCPNQTHLYFWSAHRAALDREREAKKRAKLAYNAQLRNERRGTLRHLLDLSDLPESHLSKSELHELDEYVWHTATIGIRAKWTPEREAEARGVDMRNLARVFLHDGRYYQASVLQIESGVESEFEEIIGPSSHPWF